MLLRMVYYLLLITYSLLPITYSLILVNSYIQKHDWRVICDIKV